MKKTSTIILILLIKKSIAQSVFIGGGIGYGIPSERTLIGYHHTIQGYYPIEVKSSTVYGSYGAGLSADFNVNVFITQRFSLGVSANYLKGKEYSYSSYLSNHTTFSGYTYDSTSYDSVSARCDLFRLTPCVSLTFGDYTRHRIVPYLKIGAIVNVFSRVYLTDSISILAHTYDNWFGSQYSFYYQASKTDWIYKNGFSVGATATFGINYKITNHFILYSEISIISQSWTPKVAEARDGTQKINFAESYSYKVSQPPNIPPQNSYSLNSLTGILGLKIGIGRVHFGIDEVPKK